MKITKSKHWPKIKKAIPKQFFNTLLIIYYKIQKVRYSGINVYCPVCELNLRSFKINSSCPACGAANRQKALWLFLSRKTDFLKKRLSVLHFAPEYCFYYKMKKLPNLQYISADLGSPRAMIKVDITNINFPDNFFDVVLSSHVLEHVDDDMKAIKELYRVQKKYGWSVHLVPIDYTRKETFEKPSIIRSEDRQVIYGHYDHKRIYGTDFKCRLESAGFIIESYKMEEICEQNELLSYGIKNGIEIFYCKKL